MTSNIFSYRVQWVLLVSRTAMYNIGYSGGRPRMKEELFNHAHARLRNVIEHAFGVLKARLLILKRMATYPFRVQRDIVVACVAIHDFLRKTVVLDSFFEQFECEVIVQDN